MLSSVRSYLALRYRSLVLGAVILAANIALGLVFARSGAGWLPILASGIATIAIFTMRGIPFRCALLASTLLWLVNNVITGSVGGVLLETCNATLNIYTMSRISSRTVPARCDRSPALPQAPGAPRGASRASRAGQ